MLPSRWGPGRNWQFKRSGSVGARLACDPFQLGGWAAQAKTVKGFHFPRSKKKRFSFKVKFFAKQKGLVGIALPPNASSTSRVFHRKALTAAQSALKICCKDLVEAQWERKEHSVQGWNGRAAEATAFFTATSEPQSGLLTAFSPSPPLPSLLFARMASTSCLRNSPQMIRSVLGALCSSGEAEQQTNKRINSSRGKTLRFLVGGNTASLLHCSVLGFFFLFFFFFCGLELQLFALSPAA